MSVPVLTTQSKIQCPHGGQAILTTSNIKVQPNGAPALLESDIHSVAGCPFVIGIKPSPCLRIEWAAGASMVSVDGVPVLTKGSVGTCYSPESAPQGVALVVNTQMKVKAT